MQYNIGDVQQTFDDHNIWRQNKDFEQNLVWHSLVYLNSISENSSCKAKFNYQFNCQKFVLRWWLCKLNVCLAGFMTN